jgi:hypothetical protein
MKLIKTTDTLKEAQVMGNNSLETGYAIRVDLDNQGKQIEKSMMTVCCFC